MAIIKATALEAPEGTLDTDEQRFVDMIREHGWFNTRIFADEGGQPDYNFTTGFEVTLRCPEIMVFAFPKDVAHTILQDIFEQVEGGLKLEPNKAYNNFTNLPVIFQPVKKALYADYLGWSRWFYAGDHFDCWQMVWSDREGRFPWHPDFEMKYAVMQADLSEGGWNGQIRH